MTRYQKESAQELVDEGRIEKWANLIESWAHFE